MRILLILERWWTLQKNKKPNLSQPIIDIHKMLQAIYRKGYLAGKRESLKTMKEVKDETRRTN